MCTIIALVSVRADFPVILATNRDEFFARASNGPRRIVRSPSTVGGRDLVSLGTWMGVTERGFFAGVTNQRTATAPDPRKRSRGEVVMKALRLGESAAVRELVGRLDGRDYNPFNLMWGDAHGLHVAYAREETAELVVEAVPPGVHVLPNDVLDSTRFFKVRRAQELLDQVEGVPFDDCARTLQAVLADRASVPIDEPERPPEGASLSADLLRSLSALNVVTPSYGTRSSTIVALAEHGVAHYLYADGPPGSTPFVDVRPLFSAEPDGHS